MSVALRIAFLVTSLWGSSSQAGNKTIHLMHFLPLSGPVWTGGWSCLPAIQMAIRHINARGDILPGYQLEHTWRDSKCDAGWSTVQLYDMVFTPPTKAIILGPGCSTSAETTAQASHHWNLTHVSWAAGSPSLSDRTRFPRFFRLVPPDTVSNPARVALMKHFNWQKVATINAAQEFFSMFMDDFVKRTKDAGISIITEEIFNANHDPITRIQNIKKQDARIIIVAAYVNAGKNVLCAAYRVGLYGPKVVWIFPSWYNGRWWRNIPDDFPCTVEQMDTAAEGQLMTGFQFYTSEVRRGLANLTIPEFYDLLRAEASYKEQHSINDYIAGNCYDSAWAAALALHCADRKLKEIGYPRTIDQCSYDDYPMYDFITECLDDVSFSGVTGKVEFGENGDPIKNVAIYQVQDLEMVKVGMFVTEEGPHHLNWLNGGIKWASSSAPRDSTLVTVAEKTIPLYLYVCVSLFAGAGILLAVGFFIFNVVHRNDKFVKLSSPNINNVLLVGCIVTYCTVFMRSLHQETAAMCTLRTFTFTLGFSMAFGALFSKTWRVYKIFANKKLRRLKIQDSQLVGLVAVLLVILTTVLVIWEIVDPLVIVTTYLKHEVYLSGNDAEVHPFVRMCVSQYDTYFSCTIYVIEGLLLTFGAFLSFETRKLKIPGLNDSRLIGLCLYNVVVLAALGLTLSLVLQENVALLYGMHSGFIIIGTTATQVIVFVPKVAAVYWPNRVDNVPTRPTLPGQPGGRAADLSKPSGSNISTIPCPVDKPTTSSSVRL